MSSPAVRCTQLKQDDKPWQPQEHQIRQKLNIVFKACMQEDVNTPKTWRGYPKTKKNKSAAFLLCLNLRILPHSCMFKYWGFRSSLLFWQFLPQPGQGSSHFFPMEVKQTQNLAERRDQTLSFVAKIRQRGPRGGTAGKESEWKSYTRSSFRVCSLCRPSGLCALLSSSENS